MESFDAEEDWLVIRIGFALSSLGCALAPFRLSVGRCQGVERRENVYWPRGHPAFNTVKKMRKRPWCAHRVKGIPATLAVKFDTGLTGQARSVPPGADPAHRHQCAGVRA